MLTTTLSPAELELLNSIVVKRSSSVTAVELLWVMALALKIVFLFRYIIT